MNFSSLVPVLATGPPTSSCRGQVDLASHHDRRRSIGAADLAKDASRDHRHAPRFEPLQIVLVRCEAVESQLCGAAPRFSSLSPPFPLAEPTLEAVRLPLPYRPEDPTPCSLEVRVTDRAPVQAPSPLRECFEEKDVVVDARWFFLALQEQNQASSLLLLLLLLLRPRPLPLP